MFRRRRLLIEARVCDWIHVGEAHVGEIVNHGGIRRGVDRFRGGGYRRSGCGCDCGGGGGEAGALRGGFFLCAVVLGLERFVLWEQPPSGTLRRTPPLDQ